MTQEEKDRLAALERRAAEADARNASLEASLKAVQAQRREDLVSKYTDRVVPANRAAVLAFGEFCGEDLAKFEAHLKTLPVLTRKDPQGAAPGGGPEADAADATAGERKVARIFGVSVEKMRATEGVIGVYADGSVAVADPREDNGERILTRAEYQARMAATTKGATA